MKRGVYYVIYVYASCDKEIVTIFIRKCGNDFNYSIGRAGKSKT